MPPFEGFEPINLRQGSSLYDNIVDDVNSYRNGLKGKVHISVHSTREDVVATRDIIVGQHPLYEPGTPEWDEYVLGKDQTIQEEQQNHQETKEEQYESFPSRNEKSRPTSKQRDRGNRSSSRRRSGSTSGCQNPSALLEWLEMFTTMCVAVKPPKNCSTWTTDDMEPYVEELKNKVQRKPSVHSDDGGAATTSSATRTTASLPTPTIHKNRFLYPIAKYPSRLDSQRLVEQRRKFLQNQIDFKPLHLENVYSKSRKSKKF